jgi:hypothetical protein
MESTCTKAPPQKINLNRSTTCRRACDKAPTHHHAGAEKDRGEGQQWSGLSDLLAQQFK